LYYVQYGRLMGFLMRGRRSSPSSSALLGAAG
jgi:hypothetical protein